MGLFSPIKGAQTLPKPNLENFTTKYPFNIKEKKGADLTKKGANLTTFGQEKKGADLTKKGANLTNRPKQESRW